MIKSNINIPIFSLTLALVAWWVRDPQQQFTLTTGILTSKPPLSSIKFYGTYVSKNISKDYPEEKINNEVTSKLRNIFCIKIKIKKNVLWFRICSITRTHQYIWVIAWCTELYERTRSPWRKTKVWQFWVLIWAEATLCTDLQPLRWSPQSEIVLNA